jgi:hypothetical protein
MPGAVKALDLYGGQTRLAGSLKQRSGIAIRFKTKKKALSRAFLTEDNESKEYLADTSNDFVI